MGPKGPDLVGDPSGPQARDQWFNATPIGSAGSAFCRPARGTFGDMPCNERREPGYFTAFFGADPQRNLQFAIRFQF